MSKVMRSVKNVTKGYSSVQVKVRDATSNDPWGPTGTQMSEIAKLTYNSSTEFYDIVDMLDKRLNDKGKNWRHVLKALKVLDYCLHEGSELIVTWARKNIYVIKTLREFMYVDEEGRDVGQNVRVAAKELTSLIQDEERLKAERTDRKTWKGRVTGIEEFAPEGAAGPSQQRRPRPRRYSTDDDVEYRLAIEASKAQEEEDRRRREGRPAGVPDDDDLAKAIKLSQEEDERRRRENLDSTNSASLFDDDLIQTSQPQPTGTNMGYQQGSNVDWFGNSLDANQQMQTQPTGYIQNQYTAYPNNGYQNGFGANDMYNMNNNPYGQPNQAQPFQMQPTGYNPYAQQQQQQQPFQPQQTFSEPPPPQAGSNNPWATNNNQSLSPASPIQPMKTGSNNPFATGMSFQRPKTAQPQRAPTLNSLQSMPEQKSLQTFTPPPQQSSAFNPPPPQQPQKPLDPLDEHREKLSAIMASGDGMDTYGNTGNLRIPAQHTAPGMFINSAGSNASQVTAQATGNPFMRQQFTGMPQPQYQQSQMPAATGPAGMNGYPGSASNPFAARQQQSSQGQDLIQF